MPSTLQRNSNFMKKIEAEDQGVELHCTNFLQKNLERHDKTLNTFNIIRRVYSSRKPV